MDGKDVDTQTDISSVSDRGETLGLMEPLLIGSGSRHRGALTDVAIALAAKSAGFRRSLPEGVLMALADLVRALRHDYSGDAQQRDLQLEARAHIMVQRWIDTGGLRGRSTTVEGLCEIHRRFGELLPDTLRWVEDPDTHERSQVIPGALRTRDV